VCPQLFVKTKYIDTLIKLLLTLLTYGKLANQIARLAAIVVKRFLTMKSWVPST